MKKNLGKLFLVLAMTGISLTAFGRSITQTINMFDDEFFRGDVIKLKQLLRDEAPGMRLNKMKLKKIVLVAKSERGRGQVKFMIGSGQEVLPVAGNRYDFDNPARSTFDRVVYRVPSFTGQGPWQIKVKGHLKIRKINLTLEKKRNGWDDDFDYPERLVELNRFYNGREGDHNITTQRYADYGYHFESTLGKIFMNYEPGTEALYECLVNGKDHMLSRNSRCEGTRMLGIAGYILTKKKPGTKAIYRCLTRGGDHFASTHKNCEGQRREGILGYVK